MNSKLIYALATAAVVAGTLPAHAQIFGRGGIIGGDVGNFIRGGVEEPIRRSNVTPPAAVQSTPKPGPMGPCPGNPGVCMQHK